MAIKKENKGDVTVVTFESDETDMEIAPLERSKEVVQVTVNDEDKKTV